MNGIAPNQRITATVVLAKATGTESRKNSTGESDPMTPNR